MTSFEPSDSFIGFQSDTPAAVVFKASRVIAKKESKGSIEVDSCLLYKNKDTEMLMRSILCYVASSMIKHDSRTIFILYSSAGIPRPGDPGNPSRQLRSCLQMLSLI